MIPDVDRLRLGGGRDRVADMSAEERHVQIELLLTPTKCLPEEADMILDRQGTQHR